MNKSKLAVKTVILPCIFNPAKSWVVTRTAQRKYRLNQMIHGRLFYSKFSTSRKYGVSEATCRTMDELDDIFRGGL